MKRSSVVADCLTAPAAVFAIAVPNSSAGRILAFPSILANARDVYLASCDGDPNLLPEDQAAIGAVQKVIQGWGKLIIVYRPPKRS